MGLPWQKSTRICLLHALPGCFHGIRFSVMSLFIFSVHGAKIRDRVPALRFRQEDTLIPRKGFYLLPINGLNKALVARVHCDWLLPIWYLINNSIANFHVYMRSLEIEKLIKYMNEYIIREHN